jgi:very-short-patch-repair endonuclease
MPKRFNFNYQKPIRKVLRNNATEAEKILWQQLKGRRLLGFKFRRQHGVLKYIVDFYCPEKRLAVEVDGATHSTDEQLSKDKKRQAELEQLGIRFVRVTNDDVFSNLDGVRELIAEELGNIATTYYGPPLESPPLEKEGKFEGEAEPGTKQKHT